MAKWSYEEQRMAELAYAEEYRRRIRQRRREEQSPPNEEKPRSATEDAQREAEREAALCHERDEAKARRQRSADILARVSRVYATPVSGNEGVSDAPSDESVFIGVGEGGRPATENGGGIDTEPIRAHHGSEGKDAGVSAQDCEGAAPVSHSDTERARDEAHEPAANSGTEPRSHRIFVDSTIKVHQFHMDGATVDGIGVQVDYPGGEFIRRKSKNGDASKTAPASGIKHADAEEFFSAYGDAEETPPEREEVGAIHADTDEDEFVPIKRRDEIRGTGATGKIKSNGTFYIAADSDRVDEDMPGAFIHVDVGYEPDYDVYTETAVGSACRDHYSEDEGYRRYIEDEGRREAATGTERRGEDYPNTELFADDCRDEDIDAGSPGRNADDSEMFREGDILPAFGDDRHAVYNGDYTSGAAPVGDYTPYDYTDDSDVEASGDKRGGDGAMFEEDDMRAFIEHYREQDRMAQNSRQYSDDGYTALYEMPGDERGEIPIHTDYGESLQDSGEKRPEAKIEKDLDGIDARRAMEREMSEMLRRDEHERRQRRKNNTPEKPIEAEAPDDGREPTSYDKSTLKRRKRVECDTDIRFIEARNSSLISSLELREQVSEMAFSKRSGKERRDGAKASQELKRMRRRHPLALKYERLDNERYYSFVLADIARMKVPRSADMPRLVELREKLIRLLRKRDELNARLIALYSGRDGKKRSTGAAGRGTANADAMHKERGRLAKLYGRIRRMRIDADERKLLAGLMDEQVSLAGEIAECEYVLRHEKPKGRARKFAARQLSEAKRRYKTTKKGIEKITNAAFSSAKNKRSRKRAAVAGWIGLLLIAAIVATVFWQWDNIIALLANYIPAIGTVIPPE